MTKPIIQFTSTLKDTSRLRAQLLKGVNEAAARRLEQVGQRAVQIATAEAQAIFYQGRPPDRRNASRYHYSTGFTAAVKASGGQVRLVFRNRAKHAPIIEKGQSPHAIRAGAAIPGRGVKGVHDGVQIEDAFGSRRKTVPKTPINHPGSTKGQGLMRRSMERALRETNIRWREVARTP